MPLINDDDIETLRVMLFQYREFVIPPFHRKPFGPEFHCSGDCRKCSLGRFADDVDRLIDRLEKF